MLYLAQNKNTGASNFLNNIRPYFKILLNITYMYRTRSE